MALSPDGRTVATVAFSGQTALWDVADPRRPVKMTTLPDGDGSKLGESVLPGRPDPGHRPLRPDLPVGRGQPGPALAGEHPDRPGDPPDANGAYPSTRTTSRSPPPGHPGQHHRPEPGRLVNVTDPGVPPDRHRHAPATSSTPSPSPLAATCWPTSPTTAPSRFSAWPPRPPGPHRHGPRPPSPRPVPGRAVPARRDAPAPPVTARPATRWRSLPAGTP